MSQDEVINHVMKSCGVDEDTAKRYARQVNDYTVGKAYALREYQSTKKGSSALSEEKAKQMSEDLENFIKQSPKWGNSGTLYRGISLDKNEGAALLQDLRDVGFLDMRGTSSWSSSKAIADEFTDYSGGDMKFIFRTNGTKKGTSIRHLSEFNDQDEVLVSKNASWMVDGIKQQGRNTYIVDLQEA